MSSFEPWTLAILYATKGQTNLKANWGHHQDLLIFNLLFNFKYFSANLLRKVVWRGTRRHHYKNSNGIVPILCMYFWTHYISHLHSFWESSKEIWKKENQQQMSNTDYIIGNIWKHLDQELFNLLFYRRNCNCWKVNTVGIGNLQSICRTLSEFLFFYVRN